MSKTKMVKVRCRRGHPHRFMRARLANDTVVRIDEQDGIEIDASLVSDEMRDCGWFEIEGGAAEKPEIDPEKGDDPSPDKKTSEEPEAEKKSKPKAVEPKKAKPKTKGTK